ncbi:MAG: hypothetical protein ABSA78_21455 [Candidatus Sulfotelmatobacter sp.]
MKKLIGLFVVCFVFSFVAFAQHHDVGGGAGHIPAHGPAPVMAPHPAPDHFNDKAGHPDAPHVHANESGSATIPDPTILTTISIIPGNTGASRADSGAGMSGIWRAAGPTASGLVVSISA